MALHLPNLKEKSPAQIGASERTISRISGASRIFGPFNAADLALLGALTLLLYPVFKVAHLPLRINLVRISIAFWFGTAATGTFAAVVLALIALPLSCTILPFVQRLKEKKGLIIVAAVLIAVIFSLLGPWLGLVVSVDALTAGELLERTKGRLKEKIADVLYPSAYLFCGVIFLLAFNHAVPGIRNPGTYDSFLNNVDRVLFHVNVSTLVHACLKRWPLLVFRFFEVVYYGMFIHIIGALVLLAAARGRYCAMHMVRTIVICNTMGIVVYAAMPAIGPWANCPYHQSTYPHSLSTYYTQETILGNAETLWAHAPTPETRRVDVTDAFISFPSLHVAGPLIAFWFLRGFRRMVRAYFAGYLLCLLPSILLLEWHYVIDLFAGFVIACCAIWVSTLFTSPVLDTSLQRHEQARPIFLN